MAIKIPVGFVAPITIGNFRDAFGNPTVVDDTSAPVYAVSDPGKSEVIDIGGVPHVGPRVDGVNAVGDAQQLSVTVDVRLGPDVVPLTLLAEFDVPAGEAVAGDIALGGVVSRP
jgi:hypothetical protein